MYFEAHFLSSKLGDFFDSAAMLSLAAAAFDLLTFISFAFADNSNCDACEGILSRKLHLNQHPFL